MDEMLKYAIENGIIDLSYVQEKYEMNKREEILKEHPYKIWEGKDGKWYTYLPDEKNKRKLIKRKEKAQVEDAVIKYHKEQEDDPTVGDLFSEWLEGKLGRTEISNATADRYRRQFSECFTGFLERKVKEIDEGDIEDFMLSVLYSKHMTAKNFSNFRTLVFGIFKYAKRKKYVDFGIKQVVEEIDIPRKAFRKNTKSDAEMSFNDSERSRIMDYLQSNVDIMNIGLLVMFESGMRVGELSALKCEDVSDGCISVRRTEICYEQDGKRIFAVRDFPKTEAGIREIVFPKRYMPYLRMAEAQSSGKYLFERNGERLKTQQFRDRLRTVCKKLGIAPKSPHKIRMTYATMLIDGGASDSLVMSQMGHTDIRTTFGHYYKDRMEQSQKREKIEEILGASAM